MQSQQAFGALTDVRSTSELLNEINFPIRIEKAVGSDSQLYTTKNVVIREDEEQPIGLIPHNRNVIPHKDITSWVLKEFEDYGVSYVLKDFSINARGDVYQEYVFDQNIETPDDEAMSPMMIVKQSYIGTPLEIIMGTYRFICQNGIMVGNTIDNIKVKHNELDGFLQLSLKNDLQVRFAKFASVSNLYTELDRKEFHPLLLELLMSELIPTMLKKTALVFMHEEDVINIEQEGKIKARDFEDEPTVRDMFRIINQDVTGYYLYNVLTQIATHRARSSSGRMSQYKAISNAFGI